MTAERTLIDAMARDMYVKEAIRTIRARGGSAVPTPAWYDEYAAMPVTGPGFRAEWEERARDALRALHDHGPTPAMVEAGARAIEETELRDVWEGDPKGFYWAWMDCSSAAFKASLAAELEGGANAG